MMYSSTLFPITLQVYNYKYYRQLTTYYFIVYIMLHVTRHFTHATNSVYRVMVLRTVQSRKLDDGYKVFRRSLILVYSSSMNCDHD